MKIIDISMPIHNNIICFPGNTPVKVEQQRSFRGGDEINVTDIMCSTHTGTHVDSAKHHYDSLPGIERLKWKGLVGRAYVVDLYRTEHCVKKEDIEHIANLDFFNILYIKTKNSYQDKCWETFDPNYIYIDPSAAEFIVEAGISGVGFDALAVEEFGSEKAETHKILLKNNAVVIIEGVDLRNVDEGYYFSACLPINIPDSDGAPARSILIPEEELPRHRNQIGVRRDGSYFTRIEWVSHTTDNPNTWVLNLIDDNLDRFGGTWGANTSGPANVVLSFFGEKQNIGMFRIFHNVGIDISVLEELAKTVRIYISDDDRATTLKMGEDIQAVNWSRVAEIEMEMKEKWTTIVPKVPVSCKYVRLELVENFLSYEKLPWIETSELKIYPHKETLE